MANDIIFKCCICEQDFRPEGLDKNGKCAVCRKEYPTVKNRKEAMALTAPEIRLGEKLDVEQVRQIIREELNEFKAELKVEQAKAEAKATALEKARAAKAAKAEKDKNDTKTSSTGLGSSSGTLGGK